MRLNKSVKMLSIALVGVLSAISSAHAQFPTLDVGAIFQNAKSITQQIDQYKTQILESKAVGSINSAIGDAKASMSKFNLDKVKQAKQKAEKAQKALEKVKKTKEDIEKAKAEFEEKKAKYEEYTKQLERVKKDIKSKVDDAKEMYKDAKETVSSASNRATQAVSDAKAKVAEVKENVNKQIDKVSSTKISADSVNTEIPSIARVTSDSTPVSGRIRFSNGNASGGVSLPSSRKIVSDTVTIQNRTPSGQGIEVNDLSKSIATAVAARNTEALQAISDIDEADIINSDNKMYEKKENKEENIDENEEKTPEQIKINGREETPEEPSIENDENKDIMPASENKTINAVPTVLPKNNSIIPATSRRKAFLPAAKNSFWLDDGESARQSQTKLSQIKNLQFASGASECLYNNSIQNGDDGEIVILPETMAKECCIKADKLTDLNVIKDCADKVLKKMTNSNEEIRKEGTDLYTLISSEQNIYGLAEALGDTKDSSGYFANVLVPYMKDIKKTESETTTNDKITSIAMTNVQMLYLLNRIRRIHTSALSTTGFNKMNDVLEKTLNEETDIGLGEIKGEYASSITRGINNNSETSSNEVSLEYPVIPENLAKKCSLKLDTDSIAKLKECYFKIVEEAHVKDFTERQVGINFIENIEYQDLLNILAKSLYQKVKSAQYDEELDVTKENVTSGTNERTNGDGLFKTNYEIQKALDDIVNIYATRIAHSSLENLLQIAPKATDNQVETEG